MGHVGLTPQAVNILGGYGVRGKSEEEARSIVEDSVAVAQAGAFSLVIEGVLESIAIEVTNKVACPTIGIGASAQCDGQVLVTEDMLGMFERVPKFVKRYRRYGRCRHRRGQGICRAGQVSFIPDCRSDLRRLTRRAARIGAK